MVIVGEGKGNPLQYPCLENSTGRYVWWAIVWGRRESDVTEQLTHIHTNTHTHTHGNSLGFNFTYVLARWSLVVSVLWREQ